MYWPFVWPAVTFLAITVAAFLVRAVALHGLKRWTPPAEGGSSVLDVIRVPSIFWCFVPGIAVAMEFAHLPPPFDRVLRLALVAAIIVSVTVTLAHAVGVAIARAGDRRAMSGAVTGLAQTSARGAVFIIGALVLLGALGVQITPLLTALGVGGLAVALALQDTLGNLFAGLHLLADKPVRVGDYVKIADVEGFVVDVGWRSTRVRLLSNNVVILPNSTVAKSTIINYDLPESRMALVIKVGVDYSNDPERVCAILGEEAQRAIGAVPGLLADPQPQARLIPGFGDSALEFTLAVHVARFVDQYPVQDELRKRILRRFRAEGIDIPYPTRVLHVREGNAVRGDGGAAAAAS